MQNKRRNHSAAFKAKVALAAAKGDKTIAELASEYEVHLNQITQREKQLFESLPEIFSRRRKNEQHEKEELTAELYLKRGQLKVELDWLKKNLDSTLEKKRSNIETGHKKIEGYGQRLLLGLKPTSLYYTPGSDTQFNEQLRMLIDEQYIWTPFYGIDKMTEWLRQLGLGDNHKRTRLLMRQRGREAVYPSRKRGLSIPDKENKIYPYLLKDVQIERPVQVWSADLTYVRMYRGWIYLMAVMDWFRRYVVN